MQNYRMYRRDSSVMFLFIEILMIAAATFALDCPPRDKVYPCSCDEDLGLTILNCEGFNSVSELEPAVKNTIGYNVSFQIYRSHLGDIPSDFFKGHSSVKIQFEQCVVRSYGERPFSGLEDSLEILNIYQGIEKSYTVMDSFRLNHLHKLRYVSIAYNNFESVENHWFDGGPASLRHITLIGNEMERVGDTALASLANLQLLYINRNRIRTLTRSMLPNPANYLWNIVLSSNEIEELPSDAFDAFPMLKILNLSNNKIKSIPERVWGKIWNQLETVNLDGNEIICDENLKWIYTKKIPSIFEGKCGPGNDLYNKSLNSLKLEDFK